MATAKNPKNVRPVKAATKAVAAKKPKTATKKASVKKPITLSLYKDLMTVAREGIKDFVAIARLGNKYGWREPGPAQWDLYGAVNFLGKLITVPGADEKIVESIKTANTMFVAVLVNGFRKGKSYRKTGRTAMDALRADYTANIKPELIRYQDDEKARIKKTAKAKKAAALVTAKGQSNE